VKWFIYQARNLVVLSYRLILLYRIPLEDRLDLKCDFTVCQVTDKEHRYMASGIAQSSDAYSFKETDSYILLPEIEQQGKTMFTQKSITAEVNKAFMKICLTAGEFEPAPNKTTLFEWAVEACFSELYTFCRNTVFKRCRDLPLSEDIAQESILCLLKAQDPIEQLKPWLFRVSINNMLIFPTRKCLKNGVLF